jgi:hypothetical protein
MPQPRALKPSTPPNRVQSFFTLFDQDGRVAKLFLILFLGAAIVDGLTSSQTEPPLMIDESQPGSPALDANG